jgi:hypothetical protein
MPITKYKLVKVFRTEFQQNLWRNLWDTWKIPLTIFPELGFIVDQYGYEW